LKGIGLEFQVLKGMGQGFQVLKGNMVRVSRILKGMG
jgi:hypothetical protein